MRRETGLPSMMAVILGSREVMVIGPGSPGLSVSLLLQLPVLENQSGRRNVEGVWTPCLEE
jgi:hypothetical protein